MSARIALWGRWQGFLFWKECEQNVGWQHAKLAFRGTLMAVVTFVDHLYILHLTIGIID